MEDQSYNILLTDKAAQINLSASLKGFNVSEKHCHEDARDYFLTNDPDAVLLGHCGDLCCTELLRYFKAVKPSIPVFIITDNGCETLAVTLFRDGARDYFSKSIDLSLLEDRIKEVLALKEGNERRFYRSVNGFERAIGYINDNYTKPLKLPSVARKAGMSISNFEKIFKIKMKTTFVPYVNRLRICKDMNMLHHNELAMSDIAFACGFSNQYHFARTFKKNAKVAPTVFKKSLKK